MPTIAPKMLQAMQEIIDGQTPRPIDVSVDDDAGVFAETFNEMVRVLAQREENAKQQSEKLRQTNRELIRANRTQADFLSDVSHELRTPLTAIKSSSDLLLMFGDDDPEVREEFLQNIIEACDRLMNLINELLDGSKIAAGKMEWNISDIDLIEIVRSSAGIMKGMAAEKGLKLVTELALESLNITADRDRIIQVLTNLINNAIKFTDEGQITVSVEQTLSEVKVGIADTGIGIAPENQDLIFERFTQVKDRDVGKPTGTGLGLSICQQIVEHHKGQIWVESELSKGSTFFFTLPFDGTDQTWS